MRTLFFLLLLVSGVYSSAQQNWLIELKREPIKLQAENFYISDVIDGRENQKDIGFAKTGAFNKIVRADLAGGVQPASLNYLQQCLPADTSKTPIVVRILHLDISEKTTFNSEIGRAEMKLAFYKADSGKLGLLYETESFIEEPGMDVTKGHEKRIRFLFMNCIRNFNNSNWDSIQPAWKESELVRAEKFTPAETNFPVPEKSGKPMHNLLTLSPCFGLHADGFSMAYSMYTMKPETDWIFPWVLSMEFFTIHSDYFRQSGYQSVEMKYYMPGISPYYKINDYWYGNLTFLVALGMEKLSGGYGERSENFLIGIAPSQGIYFIPKSNFGITFGIGVYERLLNSAVYKNDLGVKASIGFKF